jgi:hypothetical protein
VYDPRFSKLNAPGTSLPESPQVNPRAEIRIAKPNTDLSNPSTFISYARNQEDVMLYRAFRNLKQGFYIDVGAQDPVINSVTKAFYDLGWHGINIARDEKYCQKLQSERSRDINLTSAPGSIDQICSDCGIFIVHFLKIELEKAGRMLLEGSFESVRPLIIVLEATELESVHRSFAECEALIISHKYRFIYFDGLNRFYAAEEHADLARHFSYPPNCLDQYINYEFWRVRTELDEFQARDSNRLIYSLNHMLAEVLNVRSEAQGREWTLQRTVDERDRQIGNLQETIGQREGLVAHLEGTIREREVLLQETIREREQSIGQRDRQLVGLQTELAAAQLRLKSIRSSISWKLTKPLRETRRAAVRIVGLFRHSTPP